MTTKPISHGAGERMQSGQFGFHRLDELILTNLRIENSEVKG
jgi:hypothetical protein